MIAQDLAGSKGRVLKTRANGIRDAVFVENVLLFRHASAKTMTQLYIER